MPAGRAESARTVHCIERAKYAIERLITTLARQARVRAVAAEAMRQERPGWALLAGKYGYADQPVRRHVYGLHTASAGSTEQAISAARRAFSRTCSITQRDAVSRRSRC
jgi:hypothetical protein